MDDIRYVVDCINETIVWLKGYYEECGSFVRSSFGHRERRKGGLIERA